MPLGTVSDEVAKQIIAQDNVVPQRDGLFGESQTWRIMQPTTEPVVQFEAALGTEVRMMNPCKDCGGITCVIAEGTETHAARLVCKACGRWERWLKRIAAERLAGMV
jgi:hypothetical protein